MPFDMPKAFLESVVMAYSFKIFVFCSIGMCFEAFFSYHRRKPCDKGYLFNLYKICFEHLNSTLLDGGTLTKAPVLGFRPTLP